MGNEYAFKVVETSTLVINVEADSEEEAKKIIKKMIDEGEILMDQGKFDWTVTSIINDEVKHE